MKMKSILAVALFSIYFIVCWCWNIRNKNNICNSDIDLFLVVKKYLQKLIFSFHSKICSNQEIEWQEIENDMNQIAKEITFHISKFVRREEIFILLEKNIESKEVDFFLIPDTCIQQCDFYKNIVMLSYKLSSSEFIESKSTKKSEESEEYFKKQIEKQIC